MSCVRGARMTVWTLPSCPLTELDSDAISFKYRCHCIIVLNLAVTCFIIRRFDVRTLIRRAYALRSDLTSKLIRPADHFKYECHCIIVPIYSYDMFCFDVRMHGFVLAVCSRACVSTHMFCFGVRDGHPPRRKSCMVRPLPAMAWCQGWR